MAAVCNNIRVDDGLTAKQRYSAKLKSARHARRREWETRKYRDQHLTFDGRIGGHINQTIPQLSDIDLRRFLVTVHADDEFRSRLASSKR
jgi:hypothetical protein